ncbi:MAG: putative DNA-binding domain-containing protein [Pseudomonadota bacterium]
MADLPEFQRKQYEFAAHIRDPDNHPAPANIEDRRMAVYRELFYNNLLKLLSGTFPVLKKLHSQEKWRRMVRQFMVRHSAQTPYFLQIPKEFLSFLESEYAAGEDDFPFLLELAHYEWVELAVSVSELSNDGLAVDPHGDLLDGIPVKSNLADVYAYQYPVHRISEDFIPTEPAPQPTYLVVYRQANDELGFMELNPVTARLLDMIQSNATATGRELLGQLAAEMTYPDPDALIAHGAIALREMQDAEILLGVARS